MRRLATDMPPTRAQGRMATEGARSRAERDSAYREARVEYAAIRELRKHHPMAAHIRERRYELGMTQQQVADAAGTSHSFISRVEGGHLPGLRTLKRILAVLDEDFELTIVERASEGDELQRSTIRLPDLVAS